MKNTFGVTMAFLLALTIGGSYLGYKKATTAHHAGTEHKEGGSDHGASGTAKDHDEHQTEEHTDNKDVGQDATHSDSEKKDEVSEEQQSEDAPPAQNSEDTKESTKQPENSEASEETPSETSTDTSPETAVADNSDSSPKATADLEAGKTVYGIKCGACHGANAEGVVGPALANSSQWSVEEFIVALREGRTPTKTLKATMPKFPEAQTSDEDLVNIHAYLASLK